MTVAEGPPLDKLRAVCVKALQLSRTPCGPTAGQLIHQSEGVCLHSTRFCALHDFTSVNAMHRQTAGAYCITQHVAALCNFGELFKNPVHHIVMSKAAQFGKLAVRWHADKL